MPKWERQLFLICPKMLYGGPPERNPLLACGKVQVNTLCREGGEKRVQHKILLWKGSKRRVKVKARSKLPTMLLAGSIRGDAMRKKRNTEKRERELPKENFIKLYNCHHHH